MKKVIYNFLFLIFILTVYISINTSIENSARKQNNFNLKSIVSCTQKQLPENNATKGDFTIALNSCAKEMRSMGITGDVFVVRKSDRKLFWDASKDCKPQDESKAYMTSEGVCSLFSEPETCISTMDYIIDNPPKGDLSWKFDDSEEYVDYIYFPVKIQNNEYIIGQGAQEDESRSPFLITYFILVAGAIILIVISLF